MTVKYDGAPLLAVQPPGFNPFAHPMPRQACTPPVTPMKGPGAPTERVRVPRRAYAYTNRTGLD